MTKTEHVTKTVEYDDKTYLVLEGAKDVTEAMLEDAEKIFDDWFDNDSPIDWESFIDKFSDYGEYSEPRYVLNEYWNRAVAKIQGHVRRYKNQG